ncbi:hypothetical protein EV179_005793 [Coemansia sp. RSA 487]|nr:hypothetical protein EV179_005793 [Coemansia sp. RSA 487]
MYTVSTASAHFSRSSTAANPVPASPRRYSLHQRYPDTSFLSPPDTQLLPAFQNHQPPSRPGYHSYAPPAYEDYASPLLSEPTYHGPRYHAAATSNSAEERERKRRISHSAMERRRRERTNNVIDELKALVPWIRNEARMQKLEVLEQCVSYIKSLQQHLEPQSLFFDCFSNL